MTASRNTIAEAIRVVDALIERTRTLVEDRRRCPVTHREMAAIAVMALSVSMHPRPEWERWAAEFGVTDSRFRPASLDSVTAPGTTAVEVPAVTDKPPCAGCGTPIIESRSDARYCSNACRQRAYRQRKTAS